MAIILSKKSKLASFLQVDPFFRHFCCFFLQAGLIPRVAVIIYTGLPLEQVMNFFYTAGLGGLLKI
jgi:hypothetical protein